MKLLSLTILLVGVAMVSAMGELTGSSFCNSGTCSSNTDCDLGVCCSGKCVESYPVLNAGFGCQSNNPCGGVCPSGQSCENSVCTDIASVKGFEAGCSCSSDSDCDSGRCNGGSCVLMGLSVNDKCAEDFQCKSGNCTDGLCVGKLFGESCFDAGASGDCADGLVCSQNNNGDYVCVNGAGFGEVCNATLKCATIHQSCIGAGSVCANLYSGNEGDVCGSDVDCRMDLVCNSQAKCQATVGQACGSGATCASQTQQCSCNGTNTFCKQTMPACSTEYTAYISCVQNAGCRDLTPLDNGFPHPDQCIYECITQYAAFQCCRSCSNSSVTFAGLDCTAPTPTYTPPSPCCQANGVCNEAAGQCPALGGGNPTTTGSSSSASAAVASAWMVLVAVASYALLV